MALLGLRDDVIALSELRRCDGFVCYGLLLYCNDGVPGAM